MNAYKEIEKLNDFQLQQLKKILDELPLFEIVEQTEDSLVLREESKKCMSMKEITKNWEMIEEKDGLVFFRKAIRSEEF